MGFKNIYKGDTLTLTVVCLGYNTHVLILFYIMPIFWKRNLKRKIYSHLSGEEPKGCFFFFTR